MPIYIQGIRTVIRYNILYPGHSVGAACGSVELRDMGL